MLGVYGIIEEIIFLVLFILIDCNFVWGWVLFVLGVVWFDVIVFDLSDLMFCLLCFGGFVIFDVY